MRLSTRPMTREAVLAVIKTARDHGQRPDLSGANLEGTGLGDVDLSDVLMLDTVGPNADIWGPSTW